MGWYDLFDKWVTCSIGWVSSALTQPTINKRFMWVTTYDKPLISIYSCGVDVSGARLSLPSSSMLVTRGIYTTNSCKGLYSRHNNLLWQFPVKKMIYFLLKIGVLSIIFSNVSFMIFPSINKIFIIVIKLLLECG